MERVEFVHDYVEISIREIKGSFSIDHGHEEIHNSLAGAELEQDPRLSFGCDSVTWLHQILNIEAVLSDVICKLLNRLFRPLFDAPQELPLVSLVEVLYRLFKFYLSGSQRMDLHKLLKVEESFRDRELVSAASRGEEAFKLGPIWQLQNDLVYFS